ncbi:nucleotide exchange factor GrpE [Streptomyces sp. NPDC002133]|uniref:nucleotide exchange factor GrpE n=1 Tax=Streptomyces sp. NPDC002133 TaxID=3154409 RepID=UPI00332B51CC
MNRPTDVRSHPGPPLMLVPAGPGDGATGGTERDDPARGASPPPEQGLRAELQERTADLQRLKAEYDNYRKRVHRDRQAVREIAVANVLGRLLPVLDAIAEAGQQGEVTGGFARVVEALETELAGLGLQSVGTVGEPFDPVVHEAVSYDRSDRFERPVCTAVLRSGYRVGDQLLSPAQVAVTGPPAGP